MIRVRPYMLHKLSNNIVHVSDIAAHVVTSFWCLKRADVTNKADQELSCQVLLRKIYYCVYSSYLNSVNIKCDYMNIAVHECYFKN